MQMKKKSYIFFGLQNPMPLPLSDLNMRFNNKKRLNGSFVHLLNSKDFFWVRVGKSCC